MYWKRENSILKYYFEFEASPLEIGKISEIEKTFQKKQKNG